MLTIALSHLRERGVRLETHEAVALARELLAHPCGIATADNIQLGSDGSASCISTDGTPSVASVAGLLLTLLPAGTPNVPAPLRYAIARGLEAIEAPAFASLDEFSTALERFEQGDRRDVLRGILQRSVRPSRPIATPIPVAPAPVTPPAAGTSPLSKPAAAVPPPLKVTPPPAAPSPLAKLPTVVPPSLKVAPPSAAPSPLAKPPTVVPPPLKVTPPPAAPSPLAKPPTVVAPRPKLVVPKPAVSPSQPPRAIAAAPPLFRSVGGDGDAASPVSSPLRRAVAAAAALVAAFLVGFAIVDGITGLRAMTTTAGSPHASAGSSAAAPAVNHSAASASEEVETRDEIVRVPLTRAAAGEILPPPAAAPADAPADPPSGPVDPVIEKVSAVAAVRATNGSAFSPAFASDGTAIFFHTGGDRDSRSAIEVVNASSQAGGDQGIMTIVDDGSHNYHAQPSPDGRLVAFDSDRDGERGIYVANRDGSHARRVSGAGYAAVPTWSPDNERLAFIRPEPDKPSVWNLWVQPAAGGTARRVTNYRMGQTWAASWFPDGRRIAYSHEDALMVMDLQTGEATRYRTPVKGQLVRTPAVSPDGTKVIFQVYRRGAWLLDLADGSMERVLTDPTAEEFAWAPDGRRVAFHSRRDGQWGIYVLSRS
jgi:Tol biopolymer transport system component